MNCSFNGLALCFAGIRFESWSIHQLSYLRFMVISSVPPASVDIVHWLGYDIFLPSPFQFIFYHCSTTGHHGTLTGSSKNKSENVVVSSEGRWKWGIAFVGLSHFFFYHYSSYVNGWLYLAELGTRRIHKDSSSYTSLHCVAKQRKERQ